jgi:hypothetical protein
MLSQECGYRRINRIRVFSRREVTRFRQQDEISSAYRIRQAPRLADIEDVIFFSGDDQYRHTSDAPHCRMQILSTQKDILHSESDGDWIFAQNLAEICQKIGRGNVGRERLLCRREKPVGRSFAPFEVGDHVRNCARISRVGGSAVPFVRIAADSRSG